MCLDTISQEKPQDAGTGYKVFFKHSRLLTGELSTGSRKTRTWLRAGDSGASFGVQEIVGYVPGFHIFSSFEGARQWHMLGRLPDIQVQVIRKVKYRGARTGGKIGSHEAIVAKEIYIYPGDVR